MSFEDSLRQIVSSNMALFMFSIVEAPVLQDMCLLSCQDIFYSVLSLLISLVAYIYNWLKDKVSFKGVLLPLY